MGLFDQFPYTNFHELNLMWILEALKEIQTTTEQFVAINSLKYANPIQWNIVKQYEKNTIVIDPLTGTAYISVQPVPTGVSLTNEDYWTVVFNLREFVVRAAKNFTTRFEEETTLTATFNTAAGEWLVWGDTLYIANVNITAGDSYVVDGNIRRITVEEIKDEIYTYFDGKIGDLTTLSTRNKDNLVAAINEIVTTITQTVSNLQTAIDNEATARTQADTNLQIAIDNEAAARAQADAEISSHIGEMAHRNILLMGDSFGYGVITSGVFATKGWIEYASDYLNTFDNINCYYLLSSQASIAGNNGFASSYPFTTELTDFRNANPNVDINEIYIFAGTNDISVYGGVANGIAAFCTLARQYYGENVEINIGTIGTRIYNLHATIAPLYQQGCIDNKCNYMGKLGNLYSDVTLHYTPNAHLSQAGYDFYNPYVLNYILNKDIKYTFTFSLGVIADSGFTLVGDNPTFYLVVKEDSIKISLIGFAQPFTGLVIQPATNFNLGTVTTSRKLCDITNAPQTIADTELLINVNIYQNTDIVANGRIYKNGQSLYIQNALIYPQFTYTASATQTITYGYTEKTFLI